MIAFFTRRYRRIGFVLTEIVGHKSMFPLIEDCWLCRS